MPENTNAENGRINGRFAKGVSGNPGGRPKALVEVKALAQKHTVDAINALAKIVRTGKNEQAIIAAATALLDRAWGKPTQPLSDADGSNLPLLPLYVDLVGVIADAARREQEERNQTLQ